MVRLSPVFLMTKDTKARTPRGIAWLLDSENESPTKTAVFTGVLFMAITILPPVAYLLIQLAIYIFSTSPSTDGYTDTLRNAAIVYGAIGTAASRRLRSSMNRKPMTRTSSMNRTSHESA